MPSESDYLKHITSEDTLSMSRLRESNPDKFNVIKFIRGSSTESGLASTLYPDILQEVKYTGLRIAEIVFQLSERNHCPDKKLGAGGENRTRDPYFTKVLLCL